MTIKIKCEADCANYKKAEPEPTLEDKLRNCAIVEEALIEQLRRENKRICELEARLGNSVELQFPRDGRLIVDLPASPTLHGWSGVLDSVIGYANACMVDRPGDTFGREVVGEVVKLQGYMESAERAREEADIAAEAKVTTNG